MHSDIEKVCAALESLGAQVQSNWTSGLTMTEHFAFNAPTISREDLVYAATGLAEEIRARDMAKVPEQEDDFVRDVPRRLTVVIGTILPQLFNGGNAGAASLAYLATLRLIRERLLPGDDWQTVDKNKLPGSLLRRLEATKARLDGLNPKIEDLDEKIERIENANIAADELPVDLAMLREAKAELQARVNEASSLATDARRAQEKATEDASKIEDMKREAEKLIERCEDAYQITTTKGLAAAFDQRAQALGLSMNLWVVGLVVALVSGMYIGGKRLDLLSAALALPAVNWGSVAVQAGLSILSIGAPLWFAWLATRQIGQRFRLAEDYAFKASVAKAYEGYRKEAVKFDGPFAAQLFGSALARLDEAPLRLLDPEVHGSPAHELAGSELARRIADAGPAALSKALDTVANAVRPAATPDAAHSKPQPPAGPSA